LALTAAFGMLPPFNFWSFTMKKMISSLNLFLSLTWTLSSHSHASELGEVSDTAIQKR
jgi:hypothetical protein